MGAGQPTALPKLPVLSERRITAHHMFAGRPFTRGPDPSPVLTSSRRSCAGYGLPQSADVRGLSASKIWSGPPLRVKDGSHLRRVGRSCTALTCSFPTLRRRVRKTRPTALRLHTADLHLLPHE